MSEGRCAYRLEELSWPQAQAAIGGGAMAIVPVGSLEQHGRHLAVNTDNVIADALGEEIARRGASQGLKLLLCPAIHYGYTMHNMDFPGTITLRMETLLELGVDVVSSLVHHGCRKIVLMNAHGSNWSILDLVSRRAVSARLGGVVPARAESPLQLVLAVAALKGDRMELVVQKATELGTAEIWPVITDRTDAAARPALQGARMERWDRVASGAAEQSGRAVVPRVAPTVTLEGLVERRFAGTKIVLLERGGDPPLGSAAIVPQRRLLLFVGPAGGFEPDEIARLLAGGFEPGSLGPRILRAETAAIAAVAIAQSLWGDLAG